MTAAPALALPEALHRMALTLARSYICRCPPSIQLDDLEQAALMGAWQLVRRYGPGVAPLLAKQRIRGAILDELRAQDWLPRRTRASQPHLRVVHGADTSGPRSWEETIAAPESRHEQQLDAERLTTRALEALASAPRQERGLHIVREHHLRGRSQKAIARQLRTSEPRVSQLHARAILAMRAALTDQEPPHEYRRIDRGLGNDPPQAGGPRAVARRVRGGGLGRSTAAAAHRPVPGREREPELGDEAPTRIRRARPAPCLAGAIAAGSRAVTEPAAELVSTAEPVPSVLPSEGIDLKRELDRYRDWILEQALIRTRNNIAHAAEFVGWSVTSMHSWLKRKGIDLPPGPKGRFARRLSAPQDAPAPVAAAPSLPHEPEEPPAATHPAAERLLAKVAARIDWARVRELRREGLSDTRVAQRLAWEMGNAHRWTIEKVLRRQREQEAG